MSVARDNFTQPAATSPFLSICHQKLPFCSRRTPTAHSPEWRFESAIKRSGDFHSPPQFTHPPRHHKAIWVALSQLGQCGPGPS